MGGGDGDGAMEERNGGRTDGRKNNIKFLPSLYPPLLPFPTLPEVGIMIVD